MWWCWRTRRRNNETASGEMKVVKKRDLLRRVEARWIAPAAQLEARSSVFASPYSLRTWPRCLCLTPPKEAEENIFFPWVAWAFLLTVDEEQTPSCRSLSLKPTLLLAASSHSRKHNVQDAP